MKLWETIKNPFLLIPKDANDSSEVKPENVVNGLSDDSLYPNTGAFFDDEAGIGVFGGSQVADKLEKQKQKIMVYRNMAKNPDVADGIEEIVNEVSFSLDDDMPVKVNVDEENEKLQEKIEDSFDKITKLLNIRKNMYSIVRTGYVDGQINIHAAYDKKKVSDGIQKLKIVEPCYLYYDKKKDIYKYKTKDTTFFTNSGVDAKAEYSREELIRADFGLYEDGMNLSYLENAIKTSNQLRTLEDLLIPMRFSRSISRRVFNVDVGDLPNKKAEEAMKQHQSKFKYKKFYNAETGEVTNQQHITSMVEDYWFANRSGGKGTEADTLDETGNLGELDDILYFYKKLYKSMKIPSNRVPNNPDGDATFNYDSTQVTKEDMKFFMFIARVRQVYTTLFKELLKREIISTGVMSEKEWDEYKEKIRIVFSNENKFVEKMELDNFMVKLDIYSTASEYNGKLFDVKFILQKIFKMTEEEIDERIKAIAKEEKDPKFAKFYAVEEGGF